MRRFRRGLIRGNIRAPFARYENSEAYRSREYSIDRLSRWASGKHQQQMMNSGKYRTDQKKIADAVIKTHGRLYSEELGIDLVKNTPAQLFRWLCASLLFSARISSDIAMKAAEALFEHGWGSAQKMAKSSWAQRTQTLNEAGYARYDESTSRMLGETAAMLIVEYNGDLRKLRERAGNDVGEERRLLKEFKGIGDVGVDIFFREAQIAWSELYPFADKKALMAAKRLGLPVSAESLSVLAGKADFPRLHCRTCAHFAQE